MKKNKELTTIYIVRHGETEWNVEKLIQGQKDSSLTKKGEAQAKMLAKELGHIYFNAVFSSDLLRAKRTAEIIVLEKKLAVKTSQALRERAFGKHEGKSIELFRKELSHLFNEYSRLSTEEKFRFKFDKDIESEGEAVSRFITLLRELAVAYAGKTILVVTHGAVMRYFLIHAGFGTHQTLPSSEKTIENTAYIKVESDGVDFFIKETKGINKKS
jgi:broad specificity phosphatase PhoE